MSTTLREEFEDWYENTFLPENLHLNDYINEDSVWMPSRGPLGRHGRHRGRRPSLRSHS